MNENDFIFQAWWRSSKARHERLCLTLLPSPENGAGLAMLLLEARIVAGWGGGLRNFKSQSYWGPWHARYETWAPNLIFSPLKSSNRGRKKPSISDKTSAKENDWEAKMKRVGCRPACYLKSPNSKMLRGSGWGVTQQVTEGT